MAVLIGRKKKALAPYSLSLDGKEKKIDL